MQQLPNHLEQLGRDLDQAWQRRYLSTPRPLAWRPRRLTIALALGAALVAVGAAIASGLLKTSAEEEAGLLGGHLLFQGSNPTCVQRGPDFFRCTLSAPPTGMEIFDEHGRRVYDQFAAFKVPTVDTTKHVDGGCVALSDDGRIWDCYLGQSAVDHGIIGPQLLGAYEPVPPTG